MSDIVQILEKIEELPVDEQRRLLKTLGERLDSRPKTEEEFAEMRVRAGKMTRPDKSGATPADQLPDPVPITGEPLSETVIKERR